MDWSFTAQSPDELELVQGTLPAQANGTIVGELCQMLWLLRALAKNDLLEYPLVVRHTGAKSVTDFQLKLDACRISVEMAKVTSTNLEHARRLQAKMAKPPSQFTVDDLYHPEPFAQKLKSGNHGWPRFVADKLPKECHVWLAKWNKQDARYRITSRS